MLKTPNHLLVPIILILALIGVYASNRMIFDLWIALGFGVVFFLLNKLNFSAPAFILAFVLSPILEESLRRALLISDGTYVMFFTRPYSIGILLIILAILVVSLLTQMKRSARKISDGIAKRRCKIRRCEGL